METQKVVSLTNGVPQKILDGDNTRKGFSVLNQDETESVRIKIGAAPGTSDQDEVQTLSFSAAPGSGSFKLLFNTTKTDAIPFDAEDSDVQTALRAVPGLEAVTVNGDFETGFEITFVGGPIPGTLLRVTDNSLKSSGADSVQVLSFSGTPEVGTWKLKISKLINLIKYESVTKELPLNISNTNLQVLLRQLLNDDALTVSGSMGSGFTVTFGEPKAYLKMEVVESSLASNDEEVQTITFGATPASGAFKIAFRGIETTSLNFDANSAAIQAALRLIPGLESVTAVRSSNVTTVTFSGFVGDAPLLTIPENTLKDSAPADVTAVVAQTHVGGGKTPITASVAVTSYGEKPSPVSASVVVTTPGESANDGNEVAAGEILDKPNAGAPEVWALAGADITILVTDIG